MDASGVRRVFDLAAKLDHPINLSIGQPDFDVPEPVKDAAAEAIASGFNRNHRGNAEGGIIPEEYAVAYVLDRVDTTSTVWLGLTVGCAQCHDHKFDPISQQEFYQVFAYFNNVPEFGRAIKEGNSPPYIKAPTPEQEAELSEWDAKVEKARQRWEYRP